MSCVLQTAIDGHLFVNFLSVSCMVFLHISFDSLEIGLCRCRDLSGGERQKLVKTSPNIC